MASPARGPSSTATASSLSRWLRLVLLLAALAAVPAGGVSRAASSGPVPASLRATLVRVVDGDTIHVRVNGGLEKVRYIGINTPETHHPTRGKEPGGSQATALNRKLVANKTVRLEPDVQLRDRYGRLLAYVWVRQPDGREIMVNAELVRLGYAQAMTIPPNVRHAALFRKLQAEARAQKRGLWGSTVY